MPQIIPHLPGNTYQPKRTWVDWGFTVERAPILQGEGAQAYNSENVSKSCITLRKLWVMVGIMFCGGHLWIFQWYITYHWRIQEGHYTLQEYQMIPTDVTPSKVSDIETQWWSITNLDF